MDVFFSFRPTAKQGTVYPMELVKNQEVPGRTLQKRIKNGRSRTFYLHADNDEEQEYSSADGSGYLMVWLRWSGAFPPKPGVIPDERWYLTPRGAVVREAWDLPDEAVTGADVDVLRPTQVLRTAGVCESCHQVYSVTGLCGCS